MIVNMITEIPYALNRIIMPKAPLEVFFSMCKTLGINQVELRNDLPGIGILDQHTPRQVRELLPRFSLKVLSINALQKFNLLSAEKVEELKKLISLAYSIGCSSIVLCPNNDPADSRSQTQKFTETVKALKEFGPLLADSGLIGLIEVLGFPSSSLSSLIAAQEMIRASGCDSYRLLYDTFHHFLGPDSAESIKKSIDISLIALVHASGVETELPVGSFRDENRVLIGSGDRMRSRKQIHLLTGLGYQGPVSFEPFSPLVQNLDPDALAEAVSRSMKYICSNPV